MTYDHIPEKIKNNPELLAKIYSEIFDNEKYDNLTKKEIRKIIVDKYGIV